MSRSAFLAAVIITTVSCAPARAQGTPGSTADEKFFALLKQEPAPGIARRGLVIVDVAIMDTATHKCPTSRMEFGRIVNGKLEPKVVEGLGSNWFKATFWGLKLVPPGDYFVTIGTCEDVRYRMSLRGPHATFQVRSGEVVNVGTLHLDYVSDGIFSGSGTLKRSVTPLREPTVKYLKETIPRIFAQAVNRPMIVIAPIAKVSLDRGLDKFKKSSNPVPRD